MKDDWDVVAGLADGTRRRLYDHVQARPLPVTREEAAAALGISRSLAAFHLDKLVEAGLLAARHARPVAGARGRGRPPKTYSAAAGAEVSVTVPERRYRLMAEILASAIAEEPERAEEAARQRAEAAGRRIGAEATQPRGDEPAAVLARLGYRPRRGADGELELANCPFRALAAGHTTLICGLNHVFVAGLVEGLGAKGFRVQRVPHEDGCCVELVPEG